MTTEEKAKAYDEALKRAKEMYDAYRFSVDLSNFKPTDFEYIFPQLREREDERIRTALCDIVRDMPYMETELRAHGLTIEQALDYLEKQKEPHYTKRNALFDKCVENCDPKVMKEVSDEIDEMLGKKQKPILEVFGFKVGDAVRLKDGDGRKHIIKSFEDVEGVHGPNFYHVEFEDNSARDGIYPGEEYPNGYYTQMEKFEEEQKPIKMEVYEAGKGTTICGLFGIFALAFVLGYFFPWICIVLVFVGVLALVYSAMDKGDRDSDSDRMQWFSSRDDEEEEEEDD